MEVERSLENAEGFLLVEHPHGEEVADLEDEASGFLKQRCLSIADVLAKNDELLLTEKCARRSATAFLGFLGNSASALPSLSRSLKSLVQHDVIHRQGKERVGFAAEVGDAILDRGVNDWIGVELVRDGLVVALEEVLVDAVVFVEQLQRRFKALRETVNRRAVEALIVHTANFEDDTRPPRSW